MSPDRFLPALAASVLGAAMLLAGCGYRPLYGEAAPSANRALARTEIGPIDDRVGQMLRNELIDRFYIDGYPTDPEYRLDVGVTSTVSRVGLEKDATSTLGQVRLVATYRLVDRTGRVIGQGSARSITSFDIAESQFLVLSAERDAIARAVEEVALEITRRTGTLLSHVAASAGGHSSSSDEGEPNR